MVADKQDANIVGLYKIREAEYGVTPATGAWQTRSPTAMEDMGGTFTKTDGRVFSPSRQRRKGSVVDMDATGGFSEFLAYDNLWATEFEDFFFANVHPAGSAPVASPVAGSKVFTISATTSVATSVDHGYVTGQGPVQVTAATTLPTGMTASTDYWLIRIDADAFYFATSYADALAGTFLPVTSTGTGALTAASTAAVVGSTKTVTVRNVDASVKAGSRLMFSGFADPVNNGLKSVASKTASTIVVTETMANEATPPADATITVVGQKFAAGDLSLTVTTVGANASQFTITSAANAFAGYQLVEGSWIYIGGDDANSFFVNGVGDRLGGYARIALDGVAANGSSVTFDKATFVPVASAGTGKSVEIYFSDVIKNEADPDDIVRFSSTIERTLGRDDDGTQSEFLTGCVANEMTINGELASEITVDMGYIAQKTGTRTGAEGPLIRRVGNSVLKAFLDSAYNTTSNLFRIRLGLIDPENMAPTALFARLQTWSLTINNNVSSAKAQGVLGGFDVNVGNFDVDGELSAYFSTVDAIHAVKCNWDVTLDMILAKQNKGFYVDIPLIGLGGGQLSIEMDQAIMLPLEAAAAESPFGHTALIGRFAYLPDVAMPDQDC